MSKTKTTTIRVTTRTDLEELHRTLRKLASDVEFEFSSKAASDRLTAWVSKRNGLDPVTTAI
jgi:hypothetical protein